MKSTNIQSALSSKTKKIGLLSPLDRSRQQGNWYYMLSELRYHLVHRTFLNEVLSVHDLPPKQRQISFLNIMREFAEGNSFDHVMDMEVIQFLEKSLQQVRELIFSIRSDEPLLQQYEGP